MQSSRNRYLKYAIGCAVVDAILLKLGTDPRNKDLIHGIATGGIFPIAIFAALSIGYAIQFAKTFKNSGQAKNDGIIRLGL